MVIDNSKWFQGNYSNEWVERAHNLTCLILQFAMSPMKENITGTDRKNLTKDEIMPAILKISEAGDNAEKFMGLLTEHVEIIRVLFSVKTGINIYNNLRLVKQLANNMFYKDLMGYMHLFLAFVEAYNLDLSSKKGRITKDLLMHDVESKSFRQETALNEVLSFLFPEVKPFIQKYKEWVLKVNDYQAPAAPLHNAVRYSYSFNPELR